MTRVSISASGYELDLLPEVGGSIARFTWRGAPLFRQGDGPTARDTACFPLVPFSNRISRGRFSFDGRDICLTPNAPSSDPRHAIHGFAWQARWQVAQYGPARVLMTYEGGGGEWPWRYHAEQELALAENGLTHRLTIRNASSSPMPAGLGLHPYMPRTSTTRLLARHRGEWRTAEDGLPVSLDEREPPVDWWNGRPVGDRPVDTVYTGRDGPLRVEWPDRGLELDIEPSPELAFTVVYVPPDEPYFCVEPVTHMTDAVNRWADVAEPGLRILAPGASLDVQTRWSASRLTQRS